MTKEDYILIIQLNSGSKKAFAALYDKYVGMIYNYVDSILRDKVLAEDITQSCFMRLWEKRRQIAPDNNLPAYLYVMARNAVYKETRHQLVATKYLEYVSHYTSMPDAGTALSELDRVTIEREIDRVVEALPESRRQIFEMSARQEMTTTEIAQKLEISPKTVETQISRAVAALRKHFSRL